METRTNAVVLPATGRVTIEERTLRPLREGEVLLGSLLGGICGTDTAKYKGTEPIVEPVWPGHEFGGRVEAVGPNVTSPVVGDTVAAFIRPGWKFGGFAQQTIVEARNTVLAPLEEVWAYEPFMCGISAARRTSPRLGPLDCGPDPLERFGYEPRRQRHIAVFGTGMMAMVQIVLAQLEHPASLTVVGRSARGLERTMQLGAHYVIHTKNRSAAEVADLLRRITPGRRGVDVAYECIGEQVGLDWAHAATRMGGYVSVVGYHQSEQGLRVDNTGRDLGWRAQSKLSGHVRDADTAGLPSVEDEVMPAMRLAGKILHKTDVAPMIGGRFPLHRAAEAFAAAAQSGAGKVLIEA